MRCLITAGPTREKIDPVRFISNRSTGKMGYALARAAAARQLEVTLVSGPVALPIPEGVSQAISVESAQEMAEAVWRLAPENQLIIMAAAVADYRPKQVWTQKMKKAPGELTLALERTPDILLELGRKKAPGQLLVGFAAETEELLERAEAKLARKNLDWIIANKVADGFATDDDRVVMLGRSGERLELGPLAKTALAELIISRLLADRR